MQGYDQTTSYQQFNGVFFSHACKLLGWDSNDQPILGLLEIYYFYESSYEDFPFVPYFFKHSDR